MITIKEAEEILKKEYHVDNFLYVVDELLLPDFRADKHDVDFKNTIFTSVQQLGYSDKCDVNVYEVILNEGAQNRRVTITQEMFRILRGLGVNNAIVAFSNADRRNYRFSLLTSKYEFDGEKVVKILSNPRRYSYSLGYGTKTKTAYDFLIGKGKVNSLDELINRFSVEVVNKQFYNEIALAFTKLVGGQRDGRTFEKELNLYGVTDQNKYAEFAVRLIGRIVFCWFLKEKKSEAGIPLIPESMLALDSVKTSRNYYHDTLEPLFFELLNTNQPRRKGKFAREEIYTQIPYLNGGLFSPHADDHYKFTPELQTGQYGLVTIPNGWFEHFFEILGQYNFTVDENTSYDIELSIDPEMLGRIFENLLAEINPETGENAKKSTGSFYTPRDIVDYMVDSSILEHLKAKTGIDEAKLRALISYGKEDDELATFSMPEKKALINTLYTVTVLDPACGSGAFPIGMLQKIVYMLQEIDPEANLWFDKATENVSFLIKKEFEKKFNAGSLDYIRKLTVIQNSIFGVDIQPIAVEIARLRCFLSLVVEEKVYDDEPNRGINPLPNLDFKFIIANTLLALPHDSDFKKDIQVGQLSMFERQDHISALKAVREEYFSANDSETKKELRIEFETIQKAMLQETLSNRKFASATYQALFSWSPFENTVTNWFDPEWMFGVKDGFDVIIGNPPYIQLQKAISSDSDQKLGDLYQEHGFKTFAKTGDIYCLFYEKGFSLLKDNGLLTFITSNKWMRAGYGEKLRSFFAHNTNPLILIDFAGQKVFENATVDVNILMFEKSQNQFNTTACIAKDGCISNLSVFVEHNSATMAFEGSDSWTILSSIEQSIKSKIERHGTKLKDWNINIYRGVLTGFNDAFIIDGAKRAELIAADPKSAEIIRPILRGRDIKRYGYTFADLWIINVHNGVKEKGIPRIHIGDYPAIKAHLDNFYEKLVKRADKGDTPYNLRNCAYMDDFSKQKIVYAETMRVHRGNNAERFPRFSFIDENAYLDKTCFMITGEHLLYLLAVMNSSLMQYYIQHNIAVLDTGGFLMQKIYVEHFPIPTIESKSYKEIVDMCTETLLLQKENRDSSDIESQIDLKIYEMFELTHDEICFLENQIIGDL